MLGDSLIQLLVCSFLEGKRRCARPSVLVVPYGTLKEFFGETTSKTARLLAYECAI